MAKYKTEKRKANVGERILITGATLTRGNYANGDVCTVIDSYSGDVYVKEHPRAILSSEYEVIIEAKPSKSERISLLESQVAELQAEVKALQKRRKPATVLVHSPNESRKAVIERAKAFVGEGYDRWFNVILCTAEFHVNTDKRTVVALMRRKRGGNVITKGIAKCAPDDVFNADIGKAIALGRALGLDVSEFENAVKPTEVVVGMVVDTYIDGDFFKTVKPVKVIGDSMYSNFVTAEYTPYEPGDKIIEDTEAQY